MRYPTLTLLIVSVLLTTASAQNHPSLEGIWQMDKARSQYPAESATEVIHQNGDAIEITFTENSSGHPNSPMQLRLSADGKPMVSTVGPNKFNSRTHWEEGKLVTIVEGDRGQHMTEIRQVSLDGSTLTVTGYHQDELKKPYYVRVMTKSKP